MVQTMGNSHTDNKIKEKSREAFNIFILVVTMYIFGITVAMQKFRVKFKSEVWCYFALVIGAIYVFLIFYYFCENYLLPYLADIEQKIKRKEKNVFFWLLEWLLPAIFIQFFVFMGFWMTVAKIPFKSGMYTHPYMYGQVYKKMENYLSPEISAAGLAIKPAEVLTDEFKAKLISRGEILESEFSGYLESWIEPEDKKGQNYLNIIIELVSKIYKIPFLIALTFSFLGTLMYTLTNASYRFLINDLYPKTYASYLIRFLFAPALSLVIAYFLMNDWWTNGAPALFFFVGFSPSWLYNTSRTSYATS